MDDESDRTFLVHYARVMLAEASRRRHSYVNRDFYWTLMDITARTRVRVAALPSQGVMFRVSDDA